MPATPHPKQEADTRPYFPMFMRVEDQLCAVVGGGKIAGRRAGSLLASGARVRMVAPSLEDTARSLHREGQIHDHRARPYRDGDLEGCLLAIAATDDPATNRAVHAEAQRRGIPCNVADDANACDFIVPAVVSRGALTVAIATGGASPAVTRDIRTRIEGTFGPEWADLLALLSELRHDLKARYPDPTERAARVKDVLDSSVHEMLRDGRMQEARRMTRTLMGLGD